MKKYLLYNSLFLSFQGEGPKSGVLSVFLRTTGCNLRCSFCDTLYAVDSNFSNKWVKETPEIVVKKIKEIKDKASNLVITGGDPLLQRDLIKEIIIESKNEFDSIEIETNGTLSGRELFPFGLHFNVSPKLSNSGEPYERRINISILKEFANYEKSIFKFVVKDSEDFDEIEELRKKIGIPLQKIYIMPLSSEKNEMDSLSSDIIKYAMKYGYNFSYRLHIALGIK